jgi:hypothetical protein
VVRFETCASLSSGREPTALGGQLDRIDRQLVDQWHLVRNGKQYGPYHFSTLVEAVKRSALSRDDQVWRPGWDSWRLAHSVPELFGSPDGSRGLQASKIDAYAVHAPANISAQNTALKPAKGLTGFFKRLAQYYAEFLSTDFKKQRLPAAVLRTLTHRDGW